MSKNLPSSEDITNFYKILHNSTQSDLYTIYIVESPHNLKLHVDSWSLMSKLVKATFSLHYHYTLIYENYSKNRSTNVDKICIIYYSMIHLKCQELFIASFDKFLLDNFFTSRIFDSIFRHHDSTWCDKIFRQ